MVGSDTASRPRKRLSRLRGPAARLTLVFPIGAASHAEVGAAPFVVGREGTGLALAVPSVSKQHVTLKWDASLERHVAHDAGSRHGTVVDGVALTGPLPLEHNAVLRLAEAVLVYEVLPAVEGVAETSALPGRSVAMGKLREELARAAVDAAPMLIIGPTGAGKESVASEAHRLSGRKGPFLAVNCAALAPQLAESQLFGHVKGAFTGADGVGQGLFRAANGGTLFLDEIGELSAELQPKLLRALQQREVLPVGATSPVKVDVRIVAATNRDLAAEVERGTFRRDLYARLALWELQVPSLSERRVDLVGWLVLLAKKWAEERKSSKAVLPTFDAEAIEALLLAELPENLRTLDRFVHHQPHGAEAIGVEQLPAWLFGQVASPAASTPATKSTTARRESPSAEELLATLEKFGSVRATARHYARDRRQIYRWIETYKLDWKDREE